MAKENYQFKDAIDCLMRLENKKNSIYQIGDVSILEYTVLFHRLSQIEDAQLKGLNYVEKYLSDNFTGC